MKPILNFLKTILRAGVKSVPIGNAIVEAIENRKANKAIKAGLEALDGVKVKTGIDGNEKPHDWLSIIIQVLLVSGIIYGFVSKQISIDKFIELLNGF